MVLLEKQRAAWHLLRTPPSLETFPVRLLLRTVASQAALRARVIYRRLRSQRHPFGSQRKRTPNGPDLSLQGPMSGPVHGAERGVKEGRKEFVDICLADCPCLRLDLYKEGEDTTRAWGGVWPSQSLEAQLTRSWA